MNSTCTARRPLRLRPVRPIIGDAASDVHRASADRLGLRASLHESRLAIMHGQLTGNWPSMSHEVMRHEHRVRVSSVTDSRRYVTCRPDGRDRRAETQTDINKVKLKGCAVRASMKQQPCRRRIMLLAVKSMTTLRN